MKPAEFITRTGELPMETRSMPIKTVDAESRTVDVVFSRGAKVRRYKWEGYGRVPYDETIVVSKDAINMERLALGAPVVDSHNTYSTRAQVAVVEKAGRASAFRKRGLMRPPIACGASFRMASSATFRSAIRRTKFAT